MKTERIRFKDLSNPLRLAVILAFVFGGALALNAVIITIEVLR